MSDSLHRHEFAAKSIDRTLLWGAGISAFGFILLGAGLVSGLGFKAYGASVLYLVVGFATVLVGIVRD